MSEDHNNVIRVLHMIGSLDIGGSQSMVINLYRAVDRSKIQFDFIIDHPDGTTLVPVVEKLGARIYTMPTFKGTNSIEIKRAWNRFFLEHSEYKILHSHVRSYATLYLPIAKKHGVKTIIHSHSTSNGQGFSAVVKRVMQYPLRYQADCFFSCSKEAGIWLFGKKVVQSEKYHMIPNAIDTGLYKFNSQLRASYREQLGLGERKTYIHVGRLWIPKNHMFLLDVFSAVHQKQPESVLVLVGDGDLRDAIKTRIEQLNLNDSVLLLGNRNDVPNLLQAADCFLFPSIWEGLPVTVVEAQAAGLPCFVSDTVTKDVNLSSLVKYLPINDGPDIWAEEISKSELHRKDVIENIRDAGFDVSASAKKLTDVYLGLYNG